MLENQNVDNNMEQLILEKIDQGKTDQEIINEFMGSLNSGSSSAGRNKLSKEIKSKGIFTLILRQNQ
jgi:hypothetical protein